jgi:hypothetical protein
LRKEKEQKFADSIEKEIMSRQKGRNKNNYVYY